jgi:hypothetical protein
MPGFFIFGHRRVHAGKYNHREALLRGFSKLCEPPSGIEEHTVFTPSFREGGNPGSFVKFRDSRLHGNDGILT